MRLKLNDQAQAELLAIMDTTGDTSPSYFIQKLISQQYKLLNNPEREVNNIENREHHH